jgi:hypothetical protein
MTEQEWLESADLRKMLAFLDGKVGDRKLRLFSVACCRRIWHLLPDDDLREAVEVAEKFAEGDVALDLLRKGEEAVYEYADFSDTIPGEAVLYEAAGAVYQLCQAPIHADMIANAASTALQHAQTVAPNNLFLANDAKAVETTIQCSLCRDIVGNPFRPVTLDPAWRTANVVGIAQSIYDERVFDRLPILADALEDAGCTQEEVLKHCRQPGEHVRGCWPVDLALGRE